MEGFTRALRKALRKKNCGIDIKISPNTDKISCLLFVDDNFVLRKTNLESVSTSQEMVRGALRGGERGSFNKEYSVFVSNLPGRLDRFGLKGIFQKVGRVCDTYIPNRGGWRNQARFGFVRFREFNEANDCIQKFNGSWIRGNKIYVAMAKPKRKQQGYESRVVKRPVQRWQKRDLKVILNDSVKVRPSQGKQPYKFSLTGQKNEIIEEWLQTSLVCRSVESRDLATLSSAIIGGYGPYVKVSALSCYKFILTFPTLDEMEEALVHQEELQQWFVEIKKWAIEDFCDSRRVWLNILGVPPHGWKWENFKQIAELWGDFICLGRSTTITESFEVMKVLIATEVFQRIGAEILLTLDAGGYRVFIREAETIGQMIRKPQQSLLCTNMEDKDSKCEVPGFEDIEDLDDHISSLRLLEGAGEGSPKSLDNSNSNSNVAGVRRVNVGGQLVSLSSRTKSASFSQNGYSEELFKVAHLLRKDVNDKFIVEEALEAQAPPGFEKANAILDPVSFKSKPQSQGKEVLIQEKGTDSYSQNTVSVPPGYEKVQKNQVNSQVQLQFKPNQARKGTRSRTKSAQPSSSNETSESMIRLAQESLQVGELLGVRVIGDKKAAVERITDHLKKRKAQRKISPNLSKN